MEEDDERNSNRYISILKHYLLTILLPFITIDSPYPKYSLYIPLHNPTHYKPSSPLSTLFLITYILPSPHPPTPLKSLLTVNPSSTLYTILLLKPTSFSALLNPILHNPSYYSS